MGRTKRSRDDRHPWDTRPIVIRHSTESSTSSRYDCCKRKSYVEYNAYTFCVFSVYLFVCSYYELKRVSIVRGVNHLRHVRAWQSIHVRLDKWYNVVCYHNSNRAVHIDLPLYVRLHGSVIWISGNKTAFRHVWCWFGTLATTEFKTFVGNIWGISISQSIKAVSPSKMFGTYGVCARKSWILSSQRFFIAIA